jgi:hypothetical protein
MKTGANDRTAPAGMAGMFPEDELVIIGQTFLLGKPVDLHQAQVPNAEPVPDQAVRKQRAACHTMRLRDWPQ